MSFDLFSEYSVELWQVITLSKDGPQIVGQNYSIQLTVSKTKHTFSPSSQKLHSGEHYFPYEVILEILKYGTWLNNMA